MNIRRCRIHDPVAAIGKSPQTSRTGGVTDSAGCSRQSGIAFTLIEVMIAAAIFFMGMFAILGVLSSGLRGASLLQQNAPTAAMALSDLVITNQMEEGVDSGDFGPIYGSFRWTRMKQEKYTNGMFQVDLIITRDGKEYSTMSMLLYKPDSKRP